MPEQKRVMISSTALDRPEHRGQVEDACLRQGFFPDGASPGQRQWCHPRIAAHGRWRISISASWRTATGMCPRATPFPSPRWSTTAPASAASRGWMLVMHTSASKMSTWRARSGATARPSPITLDSKKPKRTSPLSARPNPHSRPSTNPNTNLCRKLRSTLPERPSVGAVIDEHNDTIGGRRDNVALAVLVEIAHGDRVAGAPGGERLRCPECSVALAQEHQHLGGDVGAHRQIEIAIPIEGAGPHRYRSISGRIVHGRLKRAVAVA